MRWFANIPETLMEDDVLAPQLWTGLGRIQFVLIDGARWLKLLAIGHEIYRSVGSRKEH